MSEKFEVKNGLKIPSGQQLELSGVNISGISNDTTLVDSSSSDLVTEFAVKSYIDANNQWTISDGVSSSTIESGDTLTINGTSNEVDVEVSGDSFTVGLPASVEIETKLTTAELSATGTVTLADGASLASDAAPTNDADIANKKYVDDQMGSTALSAATDSGNMNPLDLDSESLTLTGGEGMNVTHDGNTITFAGEDASDSNKGIASFNSTDFSVVSGDVTLAKDPTISLSGDLSGSATMTNLGDATIEATIMPNSVALATDTTGDYVADITAGTGLTSTGATTGENISHSLSVDANQDGNISSANSLVTVGALDSGSITSGFGSIDIGTSALSAGNTTITGTISASGELTVGTIADATSMATTAAPTDDAHIVNKKYVDDQLGATELSASSDSGSLQIDLDSETLSVVGTANEIETSMSGNELTIGLPDDVAITGTLSGNGNVTIGANEDGKDVIFYGDNDGKYMQWDASADSLVLDGKISLDDTFTQGANTNGYDATFFGSGDSKKMLWDASENKLDVDGALDVSDASEFGGAVNANAGLDVTDHNESNAGLSLSGTLVTASAAELNKLDDCTATTTELNYVDVTTLGTAEASKAVTVDASSKITLGAVEIEGSSFDINGGTIDGATIATSDVTVGADKTLDVSAGTLTLADDQISGDKVEGGTINAITVNTLSGSLASSVSAVTQASSDDSVAVATTAFVQSLVGASDLDFTVDGTAYDLDLDTQSIAFSGTANEIEITDSEADGVISMQIGLPNDVTVSNDLTVGNNIVGSADNMLLQAGDDAAHDFGSDEDKIAIQATNGVEIVGDLRPEADSTRSLGSATNHWSAMYSDEVVLEHGKTISFNATPSDNSATAVMSFPHASFKSAKVTINVNSGDEYTAREVLIVCKDDGTGAKLVEYGILSTGNSELGELTVGTNGANIELRVANGNAMPCTGVATLAE